LPTRQPSTNGTLQASTHRHRLSPERLIQCSRSARRVKSRRPSLTRAGCQASKQPVPPAPDPLLADHTSRETDIPPLITRIAS
jgi:hypothetical protein